MYGTRIRKFNARGEEIIDNVKQPEYTWGTMGATVKRYVEDEPVERPTPIINENMDIIQAKVDKYGVLQRMDNFTGENLNETINFNKALEKKKDINESKNKYIPGERLLLTIQKDKPELLQLPIYKSITTKKKDKLKNILNKLN